MTRLFILRCPIICAFTILLCLGCSGRAPDKPVVRHPSAAPAGPRIAYATKDTVVVSGGSGPAFAVPNSAAGSSAEKETAGGLGWSADGRYLAWSYYISPRMVVAESATGKYISQPCACTRGLFVGDTLVAIENDLSTVLTLTPGATHFTGTTLRGDITKAPAYEVRLIGADAAGVLVMVEFQSKRYSFFRVSLSGRSRSIPADLPGWWPYEAKFDPRLGASAIGMGSNGGPCGYPDGVALISTSALGVNLLAFPAAPTRWNVVSADWGADGKLYVGLSNWPVCADESNRAATTPGTVMVLDSGRWTDTGRKLLAYQPIGPAAYVGLRGSFTMTTSGPETQTTDLVYAASATATPQVIGAKAIDFAVSPASTTPAAHPAALPRALPTTMPPALGTVWGPDQKGYGLIEPSTIFNGGDPTGLVTQVRWASWGGPTAEATGVSAYATTSVADSKQEPVRVVAFDLGNCKGSRVYRAVEWYFPQHGETFDPRHHYDICTGAWVGGYK